MRQISPAHTPLHGGYAAGLPGNLPQHQQQQQMAALQASSALQNLAATPTMRGRGGGPRVSNAIARALRQRQTAGMPCVRL